MRKAGLRTYRNATRHTGPTQAGGVSCVVVVLVGLVGLYTLFSFIGMFMGYE